jgi:hypothetical protein
MAVLDEPLVHKRVHGANLSSVAARGLNRELVGLLRDSVTRKRMAR